MDLKLGKIAQIAHSVADVDAAEAFYERTLGLTKLFRPSPDMVFFDCGGVRLLQIQAHEPEAIAKASVLYLQCEDIVGTAAELKRRGAEFLDEPHRVAEQPGYDIWMTFLKDPDGHLLALEMHAPTGWAPS